MRETIKKISKYLKANEKILFAYLYGSMAREDGMEESDIDIAVFLEDPLLAEDPLFETKLSLRLEKLVGRSVDVRVINFASLIFVHQVLKHGKLLFSKDEKIRIEFETTNIDKYFDFLPSMEEYNKKRLERYGIR